MLRMPFVGMVAICFMLQNGPGTTEMVIQDESLIVPGVGAERIILGGTTAQLEKWYAGDTFKNVVKDTSADVFRDVFKVKCGYSVPFNEIRYYTKNKASVFLLNLRVTAVAGNSNERVTSDSIELEKGVEYFIYSYGNKALKRIRDGNSSMYIYPDEGIAVFDDDNDDDIDLYLVFQVMHKKGR